MLAKKEQRSSKQRQRKHTADDQYTADADVQQVCFVFVYLLVKTSYIYYYS